MNVSKICYLPKVISCNQNKQNQRVSFQATGVDSAGNLLHWLGISYKMGNDGLLIVDKLNLAINSYLDICKTSLLIEKAFPFIKRIEHDLAISNVRIIVDKFTGKERIFKDFDLISRKGKDDVVRDGWIPLDRGKIGAIMRGVFVPGKIVPVDFSNLESIGGDMNVSWSWIRAPKLKSIGGRAMINHCVADLQQVDTVGKNLKIYGKSYVRDNIFEKEDSYIFSRLETNSQMGNLRTIGGWLQAEAPEFPKLTTIEHREYKDGDWRRNYKWWTDKD